MGSYLSAYVFYGQPIEEGGELPWDEDEPTGDGVDDTERWWMNQHGYTLTNPTPWNGEGGWRDDLDESDRDRVYAAWKEERETWAAANPLPFTIEYVGVMDYATQFLAVPGSNVIQSLGRQERFDPAVISTAAFEAAIEPFRLFVAEHNLPTDGDLGWWLTTSYG